jgi:transposase
MLPWAQITSPGAINMSLRILTRKVKMDLTSNIRDVSELLFTQARAQHACQLFLEHLKISGGLTRAQMSRFASDLESGKIEEGFKYSRRSFYIQIRKKLLTLGLIAIEQRLVSVQDFDVVSDRLKEKYVPVRQPIPKRPPDGLNLPRLMWTICKRWNDEFLNGRG